TGFNKVDGKYVYTLENIKHTDTVSIKETTYDVPGYECVSVSYDITSGGTSLESGSAKGLAVTVTGLDGKDADVALADTYIAKPGKIVITKTIGGLVTESDKNNLSFEVTNTKTGTTETIKITDERFKVDNNGVYTLELDKVNGEAIDGTAEYTVKEVNFAITGYEVVEASYTLTNGDGSTANGKAEKTDTSITAKVKTGNDGTSTVNFLDEYEKVGKIIITKTIKGSVSEEEAKGALKFTVTKTSEGSNPEITNLTLKDFTKNSDGTYTYIIDKVKKTDTFTITETDYDVDGHLITSLTNTVNGTTSEGNTTTLQGTTGEQTVDFEDVYEKDQGMLHFTKVGDYTEDVADAETLLPIAGAEFAVYKIDDTANALMTAVSDTNGVVKFEGLKTGKYIVKETKTIEGFILDTTVYYANVTTSEFEGLTLADGSKVADNKLVNAHEKGTISLKKVNESNTDQTLADSTYGLYRVVSAPAGEGDDQEVLVATATTDSQGMITFNGVLTDTDYVIKELKAPDGYYVSELPITVQVSVDNNGNSTLQLMNSGMSDGKATVFLNESGELVWLEPEVVTSISKVDSDGKYVPGAKLHIEDMSGNKLQEWTSSEQAETLTASLVAGETYKLVEDEAPEGYKIADPVEFAVSLEQGPGKETVVTVEMVDEKEDATETDTPAPEETTAGPEESTPADATSTPEESTPADATSTPEESTPADATSTPVGTTPATDSATVTPSTTTNVPATATPTAGIATATPDTATATPETTKKPKKKKDTSTSGKDDGDDDSDSGNGSGSSDNGDNGSSDGGSYTSDSDGSPQTSDDTQIPLLSFLFALSLAGLTITGLLRRKLKK
ncbi:MAG: hypothetical protein K6G11_05425, partial [Lachnospiraceae bacterium]|nr:hypothetical protein [Lachnospiraceae bacterium]